MNKNQRTQDLHLALVYNGFQPPLLGNSTYRYHDMVIEIVFGEDEVCLERLVPSNSENLRAAIRALQNACQQSGTELVFCPADEDQAFEKYEEMGMIPIGQGELVLC